MRCQTLISAVYGELRGYHRLQIRRQVAANARLSREQLMAAAEESFQNHVHRSIARFPFYAERVKVHRGSLPGPGEHVHPEELPVWTRADQAEFFAREPRPRDSEYIHETGGSTGHVVRFHVTRESYEWRTAIMDRVYAWAGAEEGAHSLHVWGAGKKPRGSVHALKQIVQRGLQRRTFFNANQLCRDADRAACCELINRVKPAAIVGYTGILVDLARFARDHNALSWKASTLISTAEALQCGQRELLQAHLAREVFDSYGSREVMNMGSECVMHSGYHMTVDNLRVEVVDEAGYPVPAGETGRIVVTDFHNAATPFIRYEVGDMGVMAPPDATCLCGRPFPLLQRIEGRTQDIIYTPRGSVSALILQDTLENFEWVEGYQFVQESRGQLRIRLLTRATLSPERLAPLSRQLREPLGETVVDFEQVRELSKRANGKVEVVISSLTGTGD